MSGEEFKNPEILGQSTKALTNWLEKTGTANWKIAKETFEEVGKIKKEQWTEFKASMVEMRNFIDAGGFGGLMGGTMNRLQGQVQNSLEAAFAPLTNTLAQAVNKVFDLPLVQNAMSGFNTLFSRGIMALTGDMEGLRNELINHQAEVERIRAQTGPSQFEKEAARVWMIEHGFDPDALNAQATAGGVYSGQFSSMDTGVINDLLANFSVTW